MGCLTFTSFTFAILVTILVWTYAIDHHTCNARRGWHSRTSAASLSKKKSSNHNHHHGGGGKSKSKSYSHKAPPSPVTPPKLKAPPAPPEGKAPAAPSPPKKKIRRWSPKVRLKGLGLLHVNNFLLGPITFSGPYCQQNIIFQVDGTIIAPSSFKSYGSGLFRWILFTKLVGLTIQGGGTIDGSGSIWWKDSWSNDPLDDELKLIVPINGTKEQTANSSVSSSLGGKMPSIKPTAIRFYGSFDVTVTGITIQNSPQCHLKFDNCVGVSVYNFHVSSPVNSPNTDGIHLQNSKDVLIHTTDLSCGNYFKNLEG